MKTYTSDNLNLSIVLPDNWNVEENESIISVYDALDGAGAVQFSSYEVDDIDSINLTEALEDYLSDRHEAFKVEEKNGYAFSKSVDAEGGQWRYWVFMRSNTLVFTSYNCLKEDIGKEDVEVDAIVLSAIEG
jgi:hypothetical protein